MVIVTHYRNLNDRARSALDALTSDIDRLPEFNSVHCTVGDLEKAVAAINGRLEHSVFELAIREFNYALYAASGASYRHAHSSLRLSVELFLAAVYFSTNELKLRYWLSGKENADIMWGQICDGQNGVLSNFFIKPFFPDLGDEGKQYRAILNKVYRECSEFVHDNFYTHHEISQNLEYDSFRLQEWIDRAQAACLGILFCFVVRYALFLTPSQLSSVESPILDSFGHIQPIRAIFERTP